MKIKENKFCECGCGEPVKNRFVHGHNKGNLENGKPKSPPQLCACGCGEYAKPGNKFIHDHNNHESSWNLGLTKETDERVAKVANSLKGENQH